MALKFPDILEHNNSNLPLVDITEIKGNSYPLALLSDTGSISVNKRKVGAIIFVSSSQEFYGFYGQDTGSWDTPSNWRTLSTFSGSYTGSFSGSFSGSLFGTASYATQALSASWSPIISPFPFTGSALITGSLGVTGSIRTSGSTNLNLIDGDTWLKSIVALGTDAATSAYPDNAPFVRFSMRNDTDTDYGFLQSFSSVTNGGMPSGFQPLKIEGRNIIFAGGSDTSPGTDSAYFDRTGSFGIGNYIGGWLGSSTLPPSLPAKFNVRLTSGSFNLDLIRAEVTSSLGLNTIFTVRNNGQVIISGSLDVTNGITGSLLGTASYATQALTASFVPNTFVQGGNSFGAQALLGTNDNQNLAFETSGSVRMFISSSGNVGIGITSPIAPFQIKTTTLNTNGSIFFTNNSAATIGAITDAGSAVTQLQFRASSYNFTDGSGVRISNSGYGNVPSAMLQVVGSGSTSVTTTLLVQNSNATSLLRIADNGLINISGSLAVSASNFDMFNNVAAYGGFTLNSNATSTAYVGAQSVFGQVKADVSNSSVWFGTTTGGAITRLGHSGSAGGATYLNFSTNGANTGLHITHNGGPDLMTVTSAGNVGIGIDVPTARLHISGTSAATLFEIDSPSTNNILFVSGSGRIGIGTGTPLYGLDVNSDGRFVGNVRFDVGLRDNRDNTFIAQSTSSLISNRTLTIGNATYSSITFPNGNVGIGTSTPSFTLDVSGSGRFTNNVTITGSLNVTGGITGSLLGTASYATQALSASYVLNAISSSFASTASFVNPLNQNITLVGNQTITGSLTITNNLTVLGSASIQFISESTLNIGTNLITVNTFSPSARFGGLAVIDSGSSPLTSASFLYDSVHDEFVFVHRGDGVNVTSSHFLVGPQTYNDLGNEIYIPNNTLLKSQGNEHVTGSNITDTGTLVNINSNTTVTGSLNVTTGITGSFTGSFTGDGSGLTNISASSIVGLNLSQIATGSVTASVSTGTGSFTVTSGSTNFLFISSSGNVGIGTGTPTQKLHVSGGNAFINGLIYFGNGSHYLDTDNSTYAMFSSNRTLQLATSGNPVLSVFTNQNVGIGLTTTPTAKLQIRGSGTTSATTALLVENNNASASLIVTDDGQTTFGNSSAWRIIIDPTSGTNPGGYISYRGSDNFVYFQQYMQSAFVNYLTTAASSYGFRWYAQGTEALRISSVANVGIGLTSNPTTKLQVRGSGATSATTALRVENSNASASLTILDDGNIGIGTSTPSASLHISGTSAILFEIDSPTANNIMFVSGSGNVGIGTNTPTASLDIFRNNTGNIQTNNDSVIVRGNNPRLKILGTSAGSSTGDGVIQFSTGDGGDRWVITGGSTFAIGAGWYNSNTSLFRITNNSGGNTAASVFLANADSDSRFSLGFSGTNGTPLSGFTGTGRLYISSTGLATPSAMLQVRGSGTTSVTTALRIENSNASASLVVRDDSNVGIGISTPSASLHIVSSSAALKIQQSIIGSVFNGLELVDYLGGIDASYKLNQSSGEVRLFAGASYFPTFYSSNAEAMRISTAGNVGIGTSSPTSRLHISGTSATALFEIDSPALNNIMFVSGSGRVGIGTGNPNSTLNVAGTTTLSSSFNTAISGSTLTVIGSGSAQPIFTVQGSQGELFSVTDSLSGSLFSVNDISGLPIMEVFSDNTILMGDYQDPMLLTTRKITQTNSGSFVVYSIPTASYDGAFIEYTIKSGSNARAGTIMSTWAGSSIEFTEVDTMDIGSTAAVGLTMILSGSNAVMTGSSSTGAWTIRTIIRTI
jgi:hypothetical protein